MPTIRRLVLASSSPWRRSLLESAGLQVEGLSPRVDEALIQGEDPVATAVLRAQAKAQAVWQQLGLAREDCLVVGADQVAHIDGEAFGKPSDPARHLWRLKMLRGRSHVLSTGVALLGAGVDQHFVCHTTVHFRADLADEELAAYVATGEGSGCAGGYMAERRGAWLIEAIEGDWSNVIGLPMFELVGRLRALGWVLPGLETAPAPQEAP